MMGYMKNYIDDLCEDCVSDRMNNVLNPKCRRRFIINVRILAGSKKDELPLFCYNQVVSNVSRFIDGKTTLFTPVDVIIYNEDFFKLFFGKDTKDILKQTQDLTEDGIKKINKISSSFSGSVLILNPKK